MTIETLLAGCGLPRAEALLLLAHASGLSRERLIAGSKDDLPSIAASSFVALARRRSAGEPIAYLVGDREFYGRRYSVDASVLIPRPETELLVDEAVRWIDARVALSGDPYLRVLDLGTGSGAIAVTLALERPAIEVVATDRTDEALTMAKRNAVRLAASVRFVSGDWFDALADVRPDRFDLIVANPPYIAMNDRHLGEGDLRFEPLEALTDMHDGMTAIERIVAGAMRRLRNGGSLMIEHGHDQASAVRASMTTAGFAGVASLRDLAGIERVTIGSVPRTAL